MDLENLIKKAKGFCAHGHCRTYSITTTTMCGRGWVCLTAGAIAVTADTNSNMDTVLDIALKKTYRGLMPCVYVRVGDPARRSLPVPQYQCFYLLMNATCYSSTCYMLHDISLWFAIK